MYDVISAKFGVSTIHSKRGIQMSETKHTVVQTYIKPQGIVRATHYKSVFA